MKKDSQVRNRLIISIALNALFSTSALADMFNPSHSCIKPIKPFQFNSQWEVDSFKNDVERYKQCISDFVDEMNEASRTHQNAAEQAINDWNRFVNYELK